MSAGVKILGSLLNVYNLGHKMDDADFQWWEWHGLNPVKRYWRRSMANMMLSMVDSPKRTLVIGCGSSPLTDMFPGKSLGVDINVGKVNFIRCKSSSEYLVSDIRDLPKRDLGMFDLIVASEILEHIKGSELGLLLPELCKLINPGGSFIAAAPDYSTFIGKQIEKLYLPYPSGFSFEYLDSLFEKEGFCLVASKGPSLDRVVLYKRN